MLTRGCLHTQCQIVLCSARTFFWPERCWPLPSRHADVTFAAIQAAVNGTGGTLDIAFFNQTSAL